MLVSQSIHFYTCTKGAHKLLEWALFNETFLPVAKFTTIETIIAIGAAMDLEMHNTDVKTTFLNRKLEEDIHIEQP
jgi:hypothetical protein